MHRFMPREPRSPHPQPGVNKRKPSKSPEGRPQPKAAKPVAPTSAANPSQSKRGKDSSSSQGSRPPVQTTLTHGHAKSTKPPVEQPTLLQLQDHFIRRGLDAVRASITKDHAVTKHEQAKERFEAQARRDYVPAHEMISHTTLNDAKKVVAYSEAHEAEKTAKVSATLQSLVREFKNQILLRLKEDCKTMASDLFEQNFQCELTLLRNEIAGLQEAHISSDIKQSEAQTKLDLMRSKQTETEVLVNGVRAESEQSRLAVAEQVQDAIADHLPLRVQKQQNTINSLQAQLGALEGIVEQFQARFQQMEAQCQAQQTALEACQRDSTAQFASKNDLDNTLKLLHSRAKVQADLGNSVSILKTGMETRLQGLDSSIAKAEARLAELDVRAAQDQQHKNELKYAGMQTPKTSPGHDANRNGLRSSLDNQYQQAIMSTEQLTSAIGSQGQTHMHAGNAPKQHHMVDMTGGSIPLPGPSAQPFGQQGPRHFSGPSATGPPGQPVNSPAQTTERPRGSLYNVGAAIALIRSDVHALSVRVERCDGREYRVQEKVDFLEQQVRHMELSVAQIQMTVYPQQPQVLRQPVRTASGPQAVATGNAFHTMPQ